MDKKKWEFSKPLEYDIPSHTQNFVTGFQVKAPEQNKELEKALAKNYENRQKMQEAIEQTAINTSETNVHLQNVIVNQNDLSLIHI